jgi:fermentation-respiration switch protein FrsA (DUF1100 family)
LLIWIAVALAGYGILVYGASRTLYYPMRYPDGNWGAQSVLAAKDVEVTASDGVQLHAWWIERPGAPLATLHLHGNAGNITHRDLVAGIVTAAGSSVLLLDYRGYGKSKGRPTEAGLYRDATAAYDWLVSKGYRPDQIIIHGESLGTAVAVELATRKPCAGIILEAPFTSARAVAQRVMPWIGPLLVWGYDSKSRIGRVNAPVFIIHGDRDEIIDYELGEELFAAAREPKRFWALKGGSHNDLHIAGQREFAARLAEFYRSLPASR